MGSVAVKLGLAASLVVYFNFHAPNSAELWNPFLILQCPFFPQSEELLEPGPGRAEVEGDDLCLSLCPSLCMCDLSQSILATGKPREYENQGEMQINKWSRRETTSCAFPGRFCGMDGGCWAWPNAAGKISKHRPQHPGSPNIEPEVLE